MKTMFTLWLFFLFSGALSTQNWIQANSDGFGDMNNTGAAGTAFDGELYVGTANSISGGQVWRYDGAAWFQETIPGFSPDNTGIAVGTVYGNSLYVGTFNMVSGCEVWRYDGVQWARVDPGASGGTCPGSGGFCNPANEEVTGLGVFDGKLYVGTGNSLGCEVWAYEGTGTQWSRVDPGAAGGACPGLGGFCNSANVESNGLVEYDGGLFVGTTNKATGCEVWRYDGAVWQRIDPGAPGGNCAGTGGFCDGAVQEDARAMAVCNDDLFVGTENGDSGGEVWAYNTSTGWMQVNTDGFGSSNNEEVISLACYETELWAGIETEDQTGAGIWRHDSGTQWTQINIDGFGDSNNFIAVSITEYKGRPYVGTVNEITGAEIWRYDPAPQTYCTAKSTLVCGIPAIGSSGNSSASATSGFEVSASPARGNRSGLLLYSCSGRAAIPFQGGLLCVNPAPLRRVPSVNSGGTNGTCDGVFNVDVNTFASGNGGGNPDPCLTIVGQQVNAQWWGRDSVPTGSFLSDGLEYFVGP